MGSRRIAAVSGRLDEIAAAIARTAQAQADAIAAIESQVGEIGDRVTASSSAEHEEALRSSKEAIARADEFDQILSIAEGGWRESLLDVRARLEIFEKRLEEDREHMETRDGESKRDREQATRQAATLATGLRALVGRVETVEQRLQSATALSDRLAEIEASFVDVTRRARMGDELALALTEYGRPKEGEEGASDLEGLDRINELSFEQLRGLGLSVTQAARLITARDARRGFTSPDQLDELVGFPPALIAELKSAVES